MLHNLKIILIRYSAGKQFWTLQFSLPLRVKKKGDCLEENAIFISEIDIRGRKKKGKK